MYMIKCAFLLYAILIIVLLAYLVLSLIKKRKIRTTIKHLQNNEIELSPQEFMEMRSKSFGGRGKKSYALTQNFSGIYILHNKTKNK